MLMDLHTPKNIRAVQKWRRRSWVMWPLLPVKELERVVEVEGGIMVLAHPFRYKDEASQEMGVLKIPL